MYLRQETPALSQSDNLITILARRALSQPNSQAYIFLTDGETEATNITYKQLDQKARLVASVLQSFQLKGERVLLIYPSGLDFIVAFFGCLYAGVIAVPVCLPRRNQSLERVSAIATNCQAKQILTTTAFKETLDNKNELGYLPWLTTDNLQNNLCNYQDFPHIAKDTVAFLQYTSGSTGAPKGVVVSHGNLMHNQQLIAKAFGHQRHSIGAGWLPLYHDMGLIGNVLQPLYYGNFCVLMSPLDFLQKPIRWLQMISRYQANTSGGPNFAYDLCVRKVTPEQMESLDLSSWDVAFTGAEPIRAESLEKFADKFAACGFRREAFYPCYGMAESTLFITGGRKRQEPIIQTVQEQALEEHQIVAVPPKAIGGKSLVGCGRAWLHTQLRIVNPHTLTGCANGEVGEIWVASDSVAQGYWAEVDKTRETFHAYLAGTHEGPFLRTGDLGFLREDGELFVTGRLKDVLIIRGKNHYPQDLEQTVQSCHPSLKPDGGAAFSIEVQGQEQVIIAQEVERTYLKKLNYPEILSRIRHALTSQHGLQVHDVVFLKPGSLPKTSSGKIQRYQCRAKFLEGSLEKLPLNSCGYS